MYGLLYSEGVAKGRISRQRFVELSSTNAAKIFGLYPKKGCLTSGSDADLVIFDSKQKVTLSRQPGAISPLIENVDYTPYEGRDVHGWPNAVISRGAILVRNGQPVDTIEAGRGQYLPRRGGQWDAWM